MKFRKLIYLCVFCLSLGSCALDIGKPNNGSSDVEQSKKCIVTFNSNGGSSIQQQEVEKGDRIVKPENPTMLGYEFVEWTYSGETWSFVGYTVSGDMTLDASWVPINYSITYRLNGGRFSQSQPTSYTIETETFAISKPTRDHYSFSGWSINGNEILNNDLVINKGSTGNIELVAVWAIDTFTVIWKNFDGSILETDENVPYGTTPQYDGSIPQKESTPEYTYTFSGWNPEISEVVCDIEYIAQFISNAKSYTLALSSEDISKGTVSGGGAFTYGSLVTISATPTSAFASLTNPYGFTKFGFSGWYDDNGCLVSNSENYTFSMPAQNLSYHAKWGEVNKKTGDSILFGIYPQTLVADTDVINTLSGIVGTANEATWTPYHWWVQNSDSNYLLGWYRDVDLDLDGFNDYRAVYFWDYRPEHTNDWLSLYTKDSINGYKKDTYYFFKYEPIQWKILESNDNTVFVMSEKQLDSHQYSEYYRGYRAFTDYKGVVAPEGIKSNNYQFSDLRDFLNVDFYTIAFSETQKTKVIETEIDNSDNSMGGPTLYYCDNTFDKIFALSYSEMASNAYGFNENRLLEVTDYASCMGCNGKWWLRSASLNYDSYAQHSSNPSKYHEDFMYCTRYGIAPAMNLSKN